MALTQSLKASNSVPSAPKPHFQKILVPRSGLELNYMKSSGPGGQNVNKRSTKAEIRFNVQKALWMPSEIREIFQQRHASHINNEGFVVVSCQKYRTQPENERNCIHKIQEYVDDACFVFAGMPTRGERKEARIQRSKSKLRSRAILKVKSLAEKQQSQDM